MALILESNSESAESMAEALRAAGYAPETETVEEPAVAAPEKTETPEPAPDAPAPESEVKPAADSEPAPTQDTKESNEDEDEDSIPDTPKKIQRKFNRLQRQRFEAKAETEAVKARAAELEKQLAELRASKAEKPAEPVKVADNPPAPVAEEAEPKWDDFADAEQQFEAYVSAKVAYDRKQTMKLVAAELAKRDEAAKVVDAQEVAKNAWAERVDAIKAEPGYEDAPTVLFDKEAEAMQLSGPMMRALQNSPIGPKIGYHLRMHPEECKRIFEATLLTEKSTQEDFAQAMLVVGEEFGAVKASLKAKPASKPTPAPVDKPVAKKPAAEPDPEPDPEPVAPPPVPEKPKPQVSRAPAPIRPVGTKAATPAVDIASMSADEFYKYREAQKNKR